MSAAERETFAMWLAVQDLTQDVEHAALDNLSLRVEALRRSQNLEKGMPAYDTCSEALRLVDSARQLPGYGEDALKWLEVQIRQNVERARKEDATS